MYYYPWYIKIPVVYIIHTKGVKEKMVPCKETPFRMMIDIVSYNVKVSHIKPFSSRLQYFTRVTWKVSRRLTQKYKKKQNYKLLSLIFLYQSRRPSCWEKDVSWSFIKIIYRSEFLSFLSEVPSGGEDFLWYSILDSWPGIHVRSRTRVYVRVCTRACVCVRILFPSVPTGFLSPTIAVLWVLLFGTVSPLFLFDLDSDLI